MTFPVDELLPKLNTTFEQHTNVVLQAPPGAGKTTRVPLALLNANWLGSKKIIMLEPRRIAARAAARFMAASLNEAIGETIGYRVRQDNKIGANTRVEVVTEGILTKILQNDPALEDYGVVIFDEFHERSLNSDLGLAMCLDAQQGLREDLRLLIMSATLDGTAVAKLLNNAIKLTSEGRSYPVEIRHRPVQVNYKRERHKFLHEVTRTILSALNEEQGSALVFLPGASEIHQVHKALRESQLSEHIILAPLFGQLTPAEQDAAIQPAPPGKRKVVLATSIAETSLTIEGIRLVIDSGLMRTPCFDPNTGLTQLKTLSVSQASADQRCGRAGRLEAGICYRLWSQATFLLPYTNPEIIDADLTPLILELALWGVSDVNDLKWLDVPPAPHVAQAKALLKQLGALDAQDKITTHGKAMAQWGAHPRLAHMMLRGNEIGAGALACEIAALLSERDVIRGQTRQSDLRQRVEAMRDSSHSIEYDKTALRQVRDTAMLWQRQLTMPMLNSKIIQSATEQDNLNLIGVILAYAYPDRISRRRNNCDSVYLLSSGNAAKLDEEDLLSTAEFIVIAQLDKRIFLAAEINAEQLLRYHSNLIQTKKIICWDDRKNLVQARKQQHIGAVIIDDEPWLDASPDAIKQTLLDGIRMNGLNCLPWNDNTQTLKTRIIFLHNLFNNQWPDMSDAALLDTLDHWLGPYLDKMSRLTHLERLDLQAILLADLPWELQTKLNELAPTHITVPSGSHIQLNYSQFPPILAVRLQELFGLTDTPRIANGKIAVLLHLLSPARRPVQITQDLAGFWQNSYYDVKKDLKGRYPKHHWPDNPLEAKATARAKRKGEK